MKKNIAVVISLFIVCSIVAQQKKSLLVGTYTKSCDSKGIHIYDFDTETGDFVLKNNSEQIINPSYLTLSANKKNIYAVTENGEQSTVSSFDFDKNSGSLKPKSTVNAEGADPCYIINDQKNVITANYSSGSICVFGKTTDGSLSTIKQIIKHEGNSINRKRQKSSHVHMVYFSTDKKYVLAADLGTDRIYVYQYNPTAAKNILILKSSVNVKKGSGPRHLTFSNDGKFVYTLQEMSGAILVYKFKNGILTYQSQSTVLSAGYTNEPRAADIHISADNKFLYASNRETANDISIFKILPTGDLTFLERTPTLGDGPRNFIIDPSGNFLLVANQKTNNIVIFRRDKITGLLTETGKKIAVCAPVCLVFE